MELPLLKLIITKGPREGETVEFRAGSTVRIGRVVRGNNLTIKDAGISSKHLVIGSDSGKWTVQDLDSSNGTALNSTPLPPFQNFDLRDGDTLKLGELTSVLVQLVSEPASQLRRNPRRRANQSSKAAPDAEKQAGQEPTGESAAGEAVDSRRGGRPRRGKAGGEDSKDLAMLEKGIERVMAESLEAEAALPPAVPGTRKGRPRKAKEVSENLATLEVNRTERVNDGSPDEEDAPPPPEVPENRRRGRPRKAKAGGVASEDLATVEVNRTERVNTGSLEEEAAPAPAAVPESRRRGRPPRARVCESNSEKAESEEVNSMATKSRRKADHVIPEEQDKKTRGGRRKENLPELPPENAQLDCVVERKGVDLGLRNAGETHENPIDVDGRGEGLDSGEKFRGGAEEVGAKESGQELGPSEREEDMVAEEGGVKESGQELGRGVREEHMVAEESGVKDIEEVTRGDSEEEDMVVEEGGVKESEEARPCDSEENMGEEKGDKGNVEVDLEKMTLGEWFDYMEENLPKQIVEVTDKMIEGMKKKAELVKQYMEEQKKMKEPVVALS